MQLIVILAVARLGAWVAGRLGQPTVVGEIAGGLLLGPSLLGRLAPELFAAVFPLAAEPTLKVLGELGLVFLMFLIGLEFHFGHLRDMGRTALAVSVAGIAAPFLLGLALGRLIHPYVAADLNLTGFSLFLAVALSITAIPILGRIMMELGVHRTRLAVLTISAAAVDDVLGWILLAAVTAIVATGFDPVPVARMLVLTLGFGAVVWLVLRPPLVRLLDRLLAGGRELGSAPLAMLMVLILSAAAVTSWIGVFAILGPFMLGAALWDQERLRGVLVWRLESFVNAFFLPIFFTYTGLRTDVGALDSGLLWLCCGLVSLAAIAGKVGGCGLAARLCGLPWRDSACVAVMMNTRALMGLIAINVGRELGVIPPSVFSMLVIMALVTTVMTMPLLRRLMPGTELAPGHVPR
ncbi:MAG TPA: cation:proton antiporter [Thermoanaerobaculia bacterium]